MDAPVTVATSVCDSVHLYKRFGHVKSKQKKTAVAVFFCIELARVRADTHLQAEVHVVLDRMRGHTETRDFFHL